MILRINPTYDFYGYFMIFMAFSYMAIFKLKIRIMKVTISVRMK